MIFEDVGKALKYNLEDVVMPIYQFCGWPIIVHLEFIELQRTEVCTAYESMCTIFLKYPIWKILKVLNVAILFLSC